MCVRGARKGVDDDVSSHERFLIRKLCKLSNARSHSETHAVWFVDTYLADMCLKNRQDVRVEHTHTNYNTWCVCGGGLPDHFAVSPFALCLRSSSSTQADSAAGFSYTPANVLLVILERARVVCVFPFFLLCCFSVRIFVDSFFFSRPSEHSAQRSVRDSICGEVVCVFVCVTLHLLRTGCDL